MTNNSITSREPKISPEALALLGGGKIAYVKMVIRNACVSRWRSPVSRATSST